MAIPHWVGVIVVLALIGGFLVFAFRQGMAVPPRRSRARFWWEVPAEPDNKNREDEA
jgi:hypothetical protein